MINNPGETKDWSPLVGAEALPADFRCLTSSISGSSGRRRLRPPTLLPDEGCYDVMCWHLESTSRHLNEGHLCCTLLHGTFCRCEDGSRKGQDAITTRFSDPRNEVQRSRGSKPTPLLLSDMRSDFTLSACLHTTEQQPISERISTTSRPAYSVRQPINQSLLPTNHNPTHQKCFVVRVVQPVGRAQEPSMLVLQQGEHRAFDEAANVRDIGGFSPGKRRQ